MKKESVWKILVGILLILNLGTIGFLVWDRPANQRNGGKPDHILIDGLKLSAAQIQQFELLKKGHRNSMDSLAEIEKGIRKNIFEEVQKGIGNDSLQAIYLNQLSSIRTSRDLITLAHFKDLYALCTPEQQTLYHNTIEEFAKRLMNPGPRPNGPRP
ncbi:MAG: hypothetical protein CFE21_08650 [Bacteroidetes bacterium B1(2017)]|nr:MAG: hypothetical protein CFE21_08650 [Bacteroidetes bacterium B1(2017)]